MTLYELTGQESGLLVADDEVLVVNWQSFEDDRMPILAPGGFSVMAWPEDEGFLLQGEESYCMDVPLLLENTTVIYDPNADVQRMFGSRDAVTAKVWTFPNGRMIIAPDGWC